ncbi:EthD family reductase [Sphingobium sp. YR768]|uniref:EthD family reductase n=1 Tax=Sphingobium sp. YR768 TaxID=1884365 RepID=UPI0008CEC3E1|nr:EthD family reductase [Sphingobium sp. YR768]SES15370.1 conserved hypothetical protein [Sphingobium sp. YR768]
MSTKLLILYAQPDDEDAFLTRYNDVHMPLARTIPGLERAVVNRVDANLISGASPYFIITELHFADKAAFDLAMASPENRAAGKDAMSFAKGKFTLLAVTPES